MSVYQSGVDGLDGPEGHPDIAFCECGSAWFSIEGEPSGVSIKGNGAVVAYVGFLTCVECGALKPHGWAGEVLS